MSKAEIRSKFDEIVAFAEVERFLDTPVKRYSSGMYVRLAFAVAAHLEPEILIVDEVLAVGDAAFQRKCLGKMESVAGEGRTVLFVSHQMDAVQRLCNKGLLLHKGRLLHEAPMDHVIDRYTTARDTSSGTFILTPPETGEHPGWITEISVLDEADAPSPEVPVLDPFKVQVRFTIDRPFAHGIVAVGINTFLDQPIRTVWSAPQPWSPGNYLAVFHMDDIHLAAGRFKLVIGLSDHERSVHHVENLAWVEILDAAQRKPDPRIINYRSGLVLDQPRVDLKLLDRS
jgi:lipopolysaccharide transport system ATP-binding protein